MNNRSIQRVVILGAIAILFVIASQAYWVIRTWNFNERDFDRSVTMALLKVAKDLSTFNQSVLPPQNLINRLSSNTFAVNVNSPIDVSTLDFYLRKNLEEGSMREDFDYAIYDCHDEKMVYGKYVAYSITSDSTAVNKMEFPQLSDATYYFVVRFPKRTAYLIETMSVNIIFTVISLLTVLFFIYSMIIILRQKRLSELQKDFINNMTHEFKTPISTIKVAADVFVSNPGIQGDSRLSKYANIIREQNNRLNTQVEKVLQITRIDRNTLELNKEIINLHELLETILPTIQVKIEGMEGLLKQELTARQPYIKADSLHLTNIIHNLLDNAMKYCKDNKPEVVIRTEDLSGHIRLTIQDKGIGIEKEHQKKVFHRFYRVPTGNIHNVKGFGLGLYYVKNIVQAHGWSIDLHSEPQAGTTITVDIPKVLDNVTTKKTPSRELGMMQ
jgi:two-component system, OmpR family, phosphate regulon sensor histidine kinase PhoR